MKADAIVKANKVFSGRSNPNTFTLNFPNGNWLSTIWGSGTYSENWMRIITEDDKKKWGVTSEYKLPMDSNTVEIMFSAAPKLMKAIEKKFGGDNPAGHVTFRQWLEVVNMLALARKYTPKKKT